MESITPAVPPEIPDVPSAVGVELPSGPVPGRPYSLPLDLLSEQYGPLVYAELGPGRRLEACSLALVDELCDESRFSKALTGRLARFRPVVGNGLFTAYPGEEGWQEAHDVLIPGFSFSGLRSYHPAMLDINRQLIAQWDAAVGTRSVDVAGDLAKLGEGIFRLDEVAERLMQLARLGFRRADIGADAGQDLHMVRIAPQPRRLLLDVGIEGLGALHRLVGGEDGFRIACGKRAPVVRGARLHIDRTALRDQASSMIGLTSVPITPIEISTRSPPFR